jgi:hypothetical protein
MELDLAKCAQAERVGPLIERSGATHGNWGQTGGTAFSPVPPTFPQYSVGCRPVPTASKCIDGTAGLPSSPNRKARFAGLFEWS